MPSTARVGKHCSQCGQPFSARACGPTHAGIHAEDKAARAGKGKTVKAWAVVGTNGRIGNRRRSSYLWISWSKRAAQVICVEGCRVVPVEVRILSEGSR